MSEHELECILEVFSDKLILRTPVRDLVAEVRRLKGLVKSVERAGVSEHSEQSGENCPWCGYAVGDWKRRHSPECPAFTESGDVR